MHLGHVAYFVRDLSKTLDFYCRGLGFAEWFTLKNDAGETAAVYVKINEREFLELFPAREKTGPNGSYVHLCLHVDDLQQELAALESRGIKVDSLPAKGKAGSLQAWITDPDGNRVELMQLLPDSLHLTGGK